MVSELDSQEQIRELERRLQEPKVQIANREDADMGVDLLGLDDNADGGAGSPPSAPGAPGPAVRGDGCGYGSCGTDFERHYTLCGGGPTCAALNHGGTSDGLACFGGATCSRTHGADGR